MNSTNENVIDKDMTEKFHVVYDGKALDEHLMDVRDLAPAMMAINDLLIHANQEINGDNLKIELKVKANFKAGSFGIEFHEILSWTKQIRDILAGQNVTALANAGGLLALLGMFIGAKAGLIQLYKALKGKPPVRIEDDVAGVKVYYTEINNIIVDKDVLRLYRNKTISNDLQKILDPLTRDGIDSLYIIKDNNKDNPEVIIDKDEIEFFEFQDEIDNDEVNISKTFVQIESLSFNETNKWKFSNGKLIFNAQILDESFLSKVNSRELRFGKGDILKVELKTIQSIAHDKLKTEYQIIKVIEHITTNNDQKKLDI